MVLAFQLSQHWSAHHPELIGLSASFACLAIGRALSMGMLSSTVLAIFHPFTLLMSLASIMLSNASFLTLCASILCVHNSTLSLLASSISSSADTSLSTPLIIPSPLAHIWIAHLVSCHTHYCHSLLPLFPICPFFLVQIQGSFPSAWFTAATALFYYGKVCIHGLVWKIALLHIKSLIDCWNKVIKAFKSQTGFCNHHTVATSSGPRENVKLIK